MKKYTAPELTVEIFDCNDVITASGTTVLDDNLDNFISYNDLL